MTDAYRLLQTFASWLEISADKASVADQDVDFLSVELFSKRDNAARAGQVQRQKLNLAIRV